MPKNNREFTDRDYKELFEQAPFGLLLCSLARTIDDQEFTGGELVEFNNAFASMIGYTPEEVRKGVFRVPKEDGPGESSSDLSEVAQEGSFLNLTPKRYSAAEAEQLKKLETDGSFGPYEKEYYHKDGHLVPIRLSGKIVSIGENEYIWSVIQTISNDEVEAFNKAPFGILLYRVSDGQIMQANFAFAEKLKYTVSEVRKRQMKHLIGEAIWDQGEILREALIQADARHLHALQALHREFIASDLRVKFAALVQARPMKVRGDDCIWELVDWLPDNPLYVVPGTVTPFDEPARDPLKP